VSIVSFFAADLRAVEQDFLHFVVIDKDCILLYEPEERKQLLVMLRNFYRFFACSCILQDDERQQHDAVGKFETEVVGT
jgi:hypothetical protein